MFKQLTVIILTLVLAHFVAISQEEDSLIHPYGSAQKLFGKTLIINVFISFPSHEWKPAEKLNALKMQQEGFRWLQNQGNSWNVQGLVFDTCNIGLEKDVQVEKVYAFGEVNNSGINLPSLILKAIGYDDGKFFYDSIKNNRTFDNVVLMAFFNKRGRSYSLPSRLNTWNKRFLETSLVYNGGLNGSDLRPGTMMHEMLHLFGAWDMYYTSSMSATVAGQIKSVFNKSIMRADRDVIDNIIVDQLTAWRIGWLTTYRPWYEMFRPSRRNENWDEVPK